MTVAKKNYTRMALGRAYTFAMAAVIAKLCKTAGASDSALMLTLCALQMLVLLLLLNKHRVTHPYTAYLQRHLQSVLNAAARRVFRLRRYDPITDALATLHWLRLPERVDFKVAVMAFRVLHGVASSYLDQLIRVADLPGRHRLRSSISQLLHVPACRLTTVGRRSFPVAASVIWNSLSPAVQSSATLSVFCQRLKCPVS